jgi:2-iminobutanoate/2-iminopropanoate deaminase
MKEVIEVPVFSEAGRKRGLPISSATKAGGFIFVSGTPPLDLTTGELVKGDISVQTRASLKALEHCLKSAGASLDDVVQVRIYAVNSGMFYAINEVYKEFFTKDFPARTFVPVASWPMEFDVEIECMAVAR